MQKVPVEFMNQLLDVVVIFQATGSPHKLMMKFKGKMVGGTIPSARLTFVNEDEESFDRLSYALWHRRRASA